MPNFLIKEINDQQVWEDFVKTRNEANFLTSWNWSRFHQSLGKKTFPLGIYQDGKLVGVALAIKEEAKRGNYLTIAGGPIIDWQSKLALSALVRHLKDLSKKEGCLFVRIRPQIHQSATNTQVLKSLGFVKSPMHLTADLTVELDLTKSEDKLLQGMRKNTRYDIRKADKLGINTTISQEPSEIKQFYDHQLQLAQKHNFVPFAYDFLYKQFEVFSQDNQAILVHSHHQGKLLASAFIILYHNEAVYHYGISTPDNHHLPGSHAVLWRAIKEAKSRGLSTFNFWGVAPKDQPDHRFYGVTIFKTGFGGEIVQYLPAHDLPTSPLYKAVNLFETIRAKKRHLS